MSFLLAFIPKKLLIWTAVLAILGLGLTAGYFYMMSRNAKLQLEVKQSELALKQQEIDNLNAMLDLQRKTVEALRRDAEVQKKATEEFNAVVDQLRQKTIEELAEISNIDIGKEANSNAAELERNINERTKRIFDSIDRVSRQGLK